jgi:hypothetical protein
MIQKKDETYRRTNILTEEPWYRRTKVLREEQRYLQKKLNLQKNKDTHRKQSDPYYRCALVEC